MTKWESESGSYVDGIGAAMARENRTEKLKQGVGISLCRFK